MSPAIVSFQRMRMELLELGEKLGWPRMPIGPGVQVKAGQGNWERLARGHISRVVVGLRNAKIRSENMHGGLDAELSRIVTFDSYVKTGEHLAAKPRKPKKSALAAAFGVED